MLITGAAGFIGHHLVEEFIDDYQIICLVRPGTKNLERLYSLYNRITIIDHDIRNKISVEKFSSLLLNLDVILHAGGNPSSASSLNEPASVVHDNVVGTINLLELARVTGVKNFVYYGAAESFGPSESISEAFFENDPYNCISPYGASKASGAEFCAAYSKAYEVPVSIVNIANTFGKRSQTNRLPVVVIKNILNKQTTKLVTYNGVIGARNWFHAADVALHTRFILDNQKTYFEKWNSSGYACRNNLSLALDIAAAMGTDLSYELVEGDPNNHQTSMLINSISPKKLYQQGYKDKFTYMERLIQTVEWYKMNPLWLERK
jgi:nucleoside-diphosphate-sugar epimerase